MIKRITLVMIFFALYKIGWGQLQPGEIHPDAIKLDMTAYDRLEPFYNGIAVIRKGTACGAIDAKGNMVIPFNKYYMLSGNESGYIYAYSNDRKSILLDNKGKEVLKPYTFHQVSKDGFAETNESFGGDKIIIELKTGKRIVIPKKFTCGSNLGKDYKYLNEHPPLFCDGLILVLDAEKHQYGYFNKKGELAIKPSFEYAEPFSDGLAVVGVRNQFSEMKYGFIDTTGKFHIQPVFSKQPRHFVNNRAYVEPAKVDSFICAYINKDGEIKHRFKDYPNAPRDFESGYIVFFNSIQRGASVMIDTNGLQTTIPKSAVFQGKEYHFNSNISIENGQIRVRGGGIIIPDGFMNLNRELVLPPLFRELSYFDPVTNLAKAIYRNNKGEDIEGYINRQGVFVIIKSPKTNW